jgi:hypothetical protein
MTTRTSTRCTRERASSFVRAKARRISVTAGVTTAALLLASPAYADDVTVAPTGAGAPGAQGMQTFINWIGQYSLWLLVGALLLGGGIIGVGQLSGHQGASRGRSAITGAGLGTMVVGMAPFLVNTLFKTFS